MSSTETPDWRESKKAATRARIRATALGLFESDGFEATTVERIADAAGVTHTTFFRYFPTKEDVALSDEYDPLIAELVRTRPATESDGDKVSRALVGGLTTIDSEFRDGLLAQMKLVLVTPSLRARIWQEQDGTARLILEALGRDDFETRALVSGILAASSTAILEWAAGNGRESLPRMVERSLAALKSF